MFLWHLESITKCCFELGEMSCMIGLTFVSEIALLRRLDELRKWGTSDLLAHQRAGWNTCSSQSHMAEQQMLWLSIWQW